MRQLKERQAARSAASAGSTRRQVIPSPPTRSPVTFAALLPDVQGKVRDGIPLAEIVIALTGSEEKCFRLSPNSSPVRVIDLAPEPGLSMGVDVE